MRELGKKLLWILLGGLLISIHIHFFLVPIQVAAGGLSGAGIVVAALFPSIDLGLFMLIGNIVLFAIGFLILGKQFGILTLAGSLSYSLWFIVLEHFFPITSPASSDRLLLIVIGSAISGAGLCLVFTQNASTGGTDILGKIVEKSLHINLGVSMMLVNGLIVVMSAFLISYENALYAIIGIVTEAVVMDIMIAGFSRRMVMNITTRKVSQVNHFIIHKMGRGTSLYPVAGGYSGLKKQAIVTVVHRSEYVRIKDYVEKVDPTAFVFVYAANEVLGEGFTYLPGQRHAGDAFAAEHIALKDEDGVEVGE